VVARRRYIAFVRDEASAAKSAYTSPSLGGADARSESITVNDNSGEKGSAMPSTGPAMGKYLIVADKYGA